MLEIDYDKIKIDLKNLLQSKNKNDQLEVAYHYGHFGFNAICLQYLIKANHTEIKHLFNHWCQIDAVKNPSKIARNDFSEIVRGNWNFSFVEELEVEFSEYVTDQREIGIYIQALPYIELIYNLGLVKKIKINCNERLRELLKIYFPYIEIGTCLNKVNRYELIEYVNQHGGAASIRRTILNISSRIRTNKNPSYIGINWYANNIYDRYRSIPIGTLINTVGNHQKNLSVKSLQYNDPHIEIDLYNTYSKNKIVEVFNNDINTSAIEILDAVAQCYCVVGVQSEAIMMAHCLLGIPTIVAASSPNFYWYFLNELNPFLHIAQMRFTGDYEYVIKTINKWL
jgi:hypothetical protein